MAVRSQTSDDILASEILVKKTKQCRAPKTTVSAVRAVNLGLQFGRSSYVRASKLRSLLCLQRLASGVLVVPRVHAVLGVLGVLGLPGVPSVFAVLAVPSALGALSVLCVLVVSDVLRVLAKLAGKS